MIKWHSLHDGIFAIYADWVIWGSTMSDELEWAKIRKPKPSSISEAGSGVMRIALLFGGLAIAMGLFVAPLLDRDSEDRLFANFGVDPITTASTPGKKSSTYIVRRSVLQSTPTSKCIVHANGTAVGDC